MIFPARELKSHCDYVMAQDLTVDRVYFRVQFLDEEKLVPELRPRVFLGRNLFPSDEGGRPFLYFRDVTVGTSPGEEPANESQLECEVEDERGYSGVVEFEDALDQLLECALRRQGRLAHG